MLKINDKGVSLYNDDYKPLRMIRDGVELVGYKEESYISKHIEVEDTYNDLLKCSVQGKHTQDSKYLIKWNQLFKTDNYSYDEYGVTVSSIDDYTLNIKVENFSCTDALILHYGVNINWVEGHKYYINGSKRTSGNSTIVISRNITGDSAGLYLTKDRIITSAYNKSYHLNTVIALSQGDFEVTFSPVVIDLTEMFGEGFEPTIEQCRKLFPCDYYPYNEGEWMPMPKGAMVNFNQLATGLTGLKNDLTNIDDYIRWEINGQYSDLAYNPITVVPKIPRVKGDKYFTSVKLRGTANGQYGFRVIRPGAGPDMSVVTLPSDEWLCKSQLGVVNDTYSIINFGNTRGDITEETTGVYVDVKDMVIINLTKMFGAGNEPTTVEEFKALYPLDYYDYVDSRYESTIGFYEDGQIVENDLASAYQTPCPEYPEEIIPVSNPKIDVTSKGVFWNQLSKILQIRDSVGITATKINDYCLSLKGISTDTAINASSTCGHFSFNTTTILPNHKYIIYPKVIGNYSPDSMNIRILGKAFNTSTLLNMPKILEVSEPVQSICNIYIYIQKTNAYIDCIISMIVTDLTLAFGDGNEPTIEEFEAMFPNDYYPYDAGTFRTIKGLHPIVPTSTEIPFELYGDGVVNDEVEPCVLVDGEWKCRVTRRWRIAEITRFYGKSSLSSPNPNGEVYYTYLSNCDRTISKQGCFCTHFKKEDINNTQQKVFTVTLKNGSNGVMQYCLPSEYDTKEKADAFITPLGMKIVMPLTTPQIELYPPINVRTLPIYSVIDCDTEIKADIKVNDITAPKHIVIAKSNWDNQVVGGVRWQLNEVLYDGTYKLTASGIISNLKDTDVVNVENIIVDKRYTDISKMFMDCKSLISVNTKGISGSNIIRMHDLFSGCTNLETIDVSHFNTSKTNNLQGFFFECSNLRSITGLNLDTSQVTNFNYMFYSCMSLTHLDLRGLKVNSARSMIGMFFQCVSLIDIDVSGWCISGDVIANSMFNECRALTDIYAYDCNQATIDFLNSVKPEGTTLHTER